MRKFLINIGVFAVIIYLVLLCCDIVISRGLGKMEEYRFQPWNEMENGGMEHDLIIMGNSRGLSHYNPSVLDSLLGVSSYCVGIGGYTLNGQIVKYEMYAQNNIIPKNIIFNVDFMTLAICTFKHQHQSEQFFPMVYNKYMRKQMLNNGFSLFDVYCPMVRYYGYQTIIKNGFMEFFNLKHYKDDNFYKGHSPELGQWDGTELNNMMEHRVEVDEKAVVMFEEFLKKCKEEDINVILVNSPVYCECTKKVSNMDEYNTYYQMVSDKYGFTYLNYTANYDLCNDTSYFCVSVHLNSKGRDVFTAQLSRDIDSLGILR